MIGRGAIAQNVLVDDWCVDWLQLHAMLRIDLELVSKFSKDPRDPPMTLNSENLLIESHAHHVSLAVTSVLLR